MSIVSNLLSGKITVDQALNQIEAWAGKAVQSLESNPVVLAAVNTFKTEATTAIGAAAAWTGTVLDADLAILAADIEAAVTKYSTKVLGGSGGAVSEAGYLAVQAGLSVAQAAVKTAVAAL